MVIGTNPAGAGIPEIREWLDGLYATIIRFGADNFSAGCVEVGKGEAAIDFLIRLVKKTDRRSEGLNSSLNM